MNIQYWNLFKTHKFSSRGSERYTMHMWAWSKLCRWMHSTISSMEFICDIIWVTCTQHIYIQHEHLTSWWRFSLNFSFFSNYAAFHTQKLSLLYTVTTPTHKFLYILAYKCIYWSKISPWDIHLSFIHSLTQTRTCSSSSLVYIWNLNIDMDQIFVSSHGDFVCPSK